MNDFDDYPNDPEETKPETKPNNEVLIKHACELQYHLSLSRELVESFVMFVDFFKFQDPHAQQAGTKLVLVGKKYLEKTAKLV